MSSVEDRSGSSASIEPDVGNCCRGLIVLDASRVLAGPFCGAILADLGADVIRIEHPTVADEVRNWAPKVDGVSAAFAAMNHSKRGLAVDLSCAEGLDVFRRLLATADVLIENFRHGTMQRFGLDAHELRTVNPRLVHCSVRAFPIGSRDEARPGYEATVQAFSGIMSLTGEHDGGPVRCGPSVTDLGTGIVSALAVLAALRERDRTGLGAYVEPALLRTATNLLTYQMAGYSLAGTVPQRRGSGHEALVPYGVFQASDGPLLIAGGNDKLWALTSAVLHLTADGSVPFPRLTERVGNRIEVNTLVNEAVGRHARADLLEALASAGVPAAPVQTVPEYMSDPMLIDSGILQVTPVHEDRACLMAGRLFGVDGTSPSRRPAPSLGEHTRQILDDLGYDAAQYQTMAAAGVVR